MCMYIYMYYIYTCTHTYIYTCKYIYIHIHIHTYTFIHTYTWIHPKWPIAAAQCSAVYPGSNNLAASRSSRWMFINQICCSVVAAVWLQYGCSVTTACILAASRSTRWVFLNQVCCSMVAVWLQCGCSSAVWL